MESPRAPFVVMDAIRKTFPGGTVANDGVSLTLRQGSLHALIGENGAGKSTLAGILYGRIAPDSGVIRLDGQTVRVDSPAAAIALGVGMVTQHATLVPALSVLDNIVLGAEPSRFGLLDRAAARAKAAPLADRLSARLAWDSPAGALSAASAQKVEILKALYRGARLLILDEPTAMLAPQEADALSNALEDLRTAGCTVLLITHKLAEVMAHSDHVTVLREGRVTGDSPTSQTSPEALLRQMLGDRPPAPAARTAGPTASAPVLLSLAGMSVRGRRGALAVRDVTLDLRAGEVVGVAGVDGSGQRELAEAIAGIRPVAAGRVRLGGTDLSRLSADARRRAGLAYVAEDRLRDGLVPALSLAENLLLGRQRDREAGGGFLLRPRRLRERAATAIAEFDIRAGGAGAPAGSLSGGNQQKLVVARALADAPRVVIAIQPTRGLDVRAARGVHGALLAVAARGGAVLAFSLDLDEILAVSDRVAVMYDGRIGGVLDRVDATVESVGRLMVGAP